MQLPHGPIETANDPGESPVTNHAPACSPRTATPADVAVPARLTWKDANGAVRFTAVTTREISESGAIVECDGAVALPLYRLVHLQVEKAAREWVELPQPLRNGRILSAVWQVGPRRSSTGTPAGYQLRFMTATANCDVPARRAS